MLTLPTGMQAKIDSAQQTLYNNAQPEMQILTTDPPQFYWEPTSIGGSPSGLSALVDITGLSETQLWIVGFTTIAGAVGTEQVWVGALNGTTWTWTAIADLSDGWKPWHIWALDINHVYFVANNATTSENAIFKWDINTSTWVSEDYPSTYYDDGGTMKAPPISCIWGGKADDIWVVGDRGLRLHWDGETWTITRPAVAPVAGQTFPESYNSNVWPIQIVGQEKADKSGWVYWVVGNTAYVDIFKNGTWQQVEAIPSVQSPRILNISFINELVGFFDAWVSLGGGTNGAGAYKTIDGGLTWTEMDRSTPNGPAAWGVTFGIWALSANSIFVSNGSHVYYFNGYGWTAETIYHIGYTPWIHQFFLLSDTIGFGIGDYLYKMTTLVPTPLDLSKYLQDGSLQLNLDDPISALSLTLKNPAGILVSETATLLKTGQVIALNFRMGSYPDWFEMGHYYIDRIDESPTNATISVDARNSVGKLLADQPIPPDYLYQWVKNIGDWISMILTDSGILPANILVYNQGSNNATMSFPRETMALAAINQLITVAPWWRIVERYDGTIVVGPPSPTEGSGDFPDSFPVASEYDFVRGTDLFSRDIVIDDQNAYREVCVKTADKAITGEEVGTGDGTNVTFYLDNKPVVPGSVAMYVDGALVEVASIDYDSGQVVLQSPPPAMGFSDTQLICTRYEITPAGDGTGSPSWWQLQGSNDGVNWDDLDDGFKAGRPATDYGGPYGWNDVTSFAPARGGVYRHYRLFILSGYGPGGSLINIVELKLYGQDTSDPPNEVEFPPCENMTANSTPPWTSSSSGCIVEGDGARSSWHAFDGSTDPGDRWIASGISNVWLAIDLGQYESNEAAVVTADYTAASYVFATVTPHEYLMVPPNKTLFEEVAEGTTPEDCQTIADCLAAMLAGCGKLETFVGPIRPQLWPGDTASIDTGGLVGAITSVKHGFGESGFSTEFPVDSGGRLGFPSIKALLDNTVEKAKLGLPVRYYPSP